MKNIKELIPNLKAIIFDLDGVLIDSMPYHAKAWIQAFEEFGIEIKKEIIFEMEGRSQESTIKKIFKMENKEIPGEKIKLIKKKKIEITEEIFKLKIFEELKDLLPKLKEKFELGLVSGSNREFVEDILKKKFKNLFSVVITGDDIERSKPFADPYLKAVKKLNLKKNECLVIENAPLGVKSAKNAGLKCIGVSTYLSKEKLKEADIILDNHEELVKYLNFNS